jgi:hypothetical protein
VGVWWSYQCLVDQMRFNLLVLMDISIINALLGLLRALRWETVVSNLLGELLVLHLLRLQLMQQVHHMLRSISPVAFTRRHAQWLHIIVEWLEW